MTEDLHSRTVVADTHNDLLMSVVERPPHRWAEFFRERWLPQLRDGGVNIQVLPVFVDDQFRPEGALRRTLRMIECAHALAEGNPAHVRLCLDGDDIDAALAADQIALVLALESAPGVSADVELFRTLHRLGVRMVSIAHWGRSALGDGSGEDSTGSRLTHAGAEALHELQRLGIVFDISHLGAAGVAHVLELSTRPLIASHSAVRALCDHHRNLTDEQIRGVAATGGVVCVNFFPAFLATEREARTIERIVDHIAHVIELVGVDHVGIGPDFLREVAQDITPPCCDDGGYDGIALDASLPGLDGPAQLPALTDAMVKRGLDENTIRAVLGGNVWRLFREQLGRTR
ncbi:membrane dipeptidase [Streptomyces sp. NPDC051214]|uniref:dipeptidase n=1 Tax=Streptomyces sp. NPDC051214 TaxID=3155282 RepID=UPI00341836E0